MKMKNYILTGIVITAFVIAGVYIYQTTQESQPRTGQSQQNQEERLIDVQLEISARYSTATLLVDSQGTISYEAEDRETSIEKQVDSIKITEQQFNDLTDLIIQNNFWSYDERYFEDNLMDATTYTLRVKSVSTYQHELADGRVYSVSCYGNCPEKIVEIINKIKELWGKEILIIGM
jgi:hypothetical protein